MSMFPKSYHEPFYMSYIKEDIKAIFEEAGFVQYKEPMLSGSSKVMSFIKCDPSSLGEFENCDLNNDVVCYEEKSPDIWDSDDIPDENGITNTWLDSLEIQN